jgi:subtilisin-like proprotein convertase family protein
MHRFTRRFALVLVAALACLAAASQASAAVFSNPAPITINGGFCPTNQAPATPYPSEIAVSGLGEVTDVNVTLNGFSHTFPDDVDVLLVGPAGQKTVLMGSVGGGAAVSGVNLTFDDAAAASLPDESQITSGSYKPTVGVIDSFCGVPDAFPAPAPPGPYGSPSLSAFNGTDPNGIWSLYVIDDTSPDSGSISGGWSLDITTAFDAEEAIGDLRDLVAGMGIHHGIANALDSKLRAALAALEADDTAGACVALQDFQNLVNAQTGKKLSVSQAQQLTDAARRIFEQICFT